MNRVDDEASGLLRLQFAPYKGQPEHVRDLRRGMKEGIQMGVVRSAPEVQDAVRRALEERRRRGNANVNVRADQEKSQDLRWRGAESVQRADGADVVDLLNSDEQFT